jgi:hypothetical protein
MKAWQRGIIRSGRFLGNEGYRAAARSGRRRLSSLGVSRWCLRRCLPLAGSVAVGPKPDRDLTSPQPSACRPLTCATSRPKDPRPNRRPAAQKTSVALCRSWQLATQRYELDLSAALDEVVDDEPDENKDDRERKKPGPPAVSCDEHIDLRSWG